MAQPAPPLAFPATSVSELERQARLWLTIAAMSSVFCLSLCLGVVGVVFCHLALESARRGYVADARDKLRWGKIVTVAGCVLGATTAVLTLIFR
jgi:tetrahydromethanopterin S-methyltransferase subunit E